MMAPQKHFLLMPAIVLGACAIAIGALLPDLLRAQQTRPIALEDYYEMVGIGSPAISADGTRVAFVRTVILEEENTRHSEIWVVPSDGSAEAVRLTSPSYSAANPRWSSDGALLAFSSGRPNVDSRMGGSVWFLRMDGSGGEAFQIEGVDRTPVFSPDSRWIAMTRPTPPTTQAHAEELSEFERRIRDRFDGRAYDWMNYRFDRRGYLKDPRDPHETPPQELYVVPRSGGVPRQLTALNVDVQGPAWRADGGVLAFTADAHQRDEHTYERADLWTVDLGGNVTRLTDDAFHYSSPAWSPDGRTIVVRGYEGLDEIIARKQSYGSPIDLFLYPVNGGEPQNLTADWDLTPGAPIWSPDGQFVYFTAGTRGNSHLFKVDVTDGVVEQVTHGDRRLSSVSFSSDFGTMAYGVSNPILPGDVFAADIDGSNEARLTTGNADLLDEVDLAYPDHVLLSSADGTEIEGWLLHPTEFALDRTYPLILVIHGGPHSAYGNGFSFQHQLRAAQGYFVLYTNPRGSTGYGERFKWAIWGGWGVLDYQDLMAAVDQVLEQYPVDRARLGVTGGSYGGFMTNWIIGHTDRFAAAVSSRSISNWVSDYGIADIPRTKESEFFGPPWEKASRDLMIELSPITYAGNVTTPTLFVHGEWDYRVPIEEAEQMYVALKKQRVPAKFIRYPESFHGGWTPWRQVHVYYSELKWWERYLK
ncbi:MAG: S9 family peptidase [Gemmatimonadota bacterium]|nr:MAG: S9 family peptidase [Gemmatimonadota bacterium]